MLLLVLFNGISFAESVYYEMNVIQENASFDSEGGGEMKQSSSEPGKVRVSRAEMVKALMHWDACASEANEGRRGLSKEAEVILGAIDRCAAPGGMCFDLDEGGEALLYVRLALGTQKASVSAVFEGAQAGSAGLGVLREMARKASLRILRGRGGNRA